MKNLNSTFQLYKGNGDQIFNLLKELLISLPHIPSREKHQWDVASFIKATVVLTLATYNTVQISKLETRIKAQEQKTDFLTDISKLHEKHLHKLDTMVDNIGEEL
jgi:hypothetical protein